MRQWQLWHACLVWHNFSQGRSLNKAIRRGILRVLPYADKSDQQVSTQGLKDDLARCRSDAEPIERSPSWLPNGSQLLARLLAMDLEDSLDMFKEDSDDDDAPLFQEETQIYSLRDGRTLSMRLVSRHVLWSHVLYPSSVCMARYLESRPELCKDKCVLEFGAAGGLPCLVAASLASKVAVMTDFPDPCHVQNMEHNIKINAFGTDRVQAAGFTWGTSFTPIRELLPPHIPSYDLVLLSDLVFNHSQHGALLKSTHQALGNQGVALCFYAHHRPTTELIEKDQDFIRLAQARGWICEKVVENPDAGPAFPEDEGDLAMRSTVHGWLMKPPA